MCGIVAATSEHRNVVPLLVQGLKRLEYRGYDSCGVAVWDQGLKRVRSVSMALPWFAMLTLTLQAMKLR